MDDLIERLRVEPTASHFLRAGDLVESLVAERKEAADRISALEAKLAKYEQAPTVAVVQKEPDYWSCGHFHEGSRPWIPLCNLYNLEIGTELIARPTKED